jgi:hypothetical protein
MDKFTLFELHVHDGMEFNATNTAPAIGGSEDAVDALEEYVDADTEETRESDAGDDEPESSRSLLPLVTGLVVIALAAVAVRKFLGSDAELEIAELDDLVDDAESYEEAEP